MKSILTVAYVILLVAFCISYTYEDTNAIIAYGILSILCFLCIIEDKIDEKEEVK